MNTDNVKIGETCEKDGVKYQRIKDGWKRLSDGMVLPSLEGNVIIESSLLKG